MSEHSSSDRQASAGPPLAGAEPSLVALREEVLRSASALAPGAAGADAPPPALDGRGGVTLERPPRADFGDYSTNAALLLAARLGAPPREVAERLGAELRAALGERLERFEVAGPGFLNLFLSDAWLRSALADVLAAGDAFGAGSPASPERVLVEFVSANPTGPMHVGHARNAAYGDALARMLEFAGERVSREFYVNDAGSQVRVFGESVRALARGEAAPEGGYQGEYVAELAARLPDAASGEPDALGAAAVAAMVEEIRASLSAFGVREFDHWSYESALHAGEPSDVERTLARLRQLGHTYVEDGALWLRTTEFGDDKDRVLVRSSGEHTYFASDIAYHEDKRERGFERQIDVWGADHHGYVLRMRAAYAALGGDPDELELLIMQLVHLVRAGERAQMSKRAGEFVTLDDLVAEIGVDAARWYLLARSHDTTVDLDLDLARSESNENPVYYVQYAHARIASMLAKAGRERVVAALGECAPDAGAADARGAAAGGAAAAAVQEGAGVARAPLHPSERVLVKQLLEFPLELSSATERRAPHRIAAYALELAQGFTAFYRDCRVLGAESDAVESQRLALCVASRRTIARSLDLLGVSAPQEM
ncbi:MAG TPA: arginine--tRNA ligase [Solirubrobacteraceae bacterium]|jgi:arginyl-tRNA synthetase|nr:arginine--tRNA ligase [Solirubrobacteraceae bacterium]